MAAPKAVLHAVIDRIGGIDEFASLYNNLDKYPNEEALAQRLGVSKSTYFKALRRAKAHSPDLFIDRQAIHDERLRRGNMTAGVKVREMSIAGAQALIATEEQIPIDDIWDRRKKSFASQKAVHEFMRCVEVNVKLGGPIGVLHVGDPHVDDDGTDVYALLHHAKLVATTEGLYAGNVGDTTNNWVGRFARLYGSQETSEEMGWRLAEDWLKRFVDKAGNSKWLYIIGGNHDIWHGEGRDPIRWITHQMGALYKPSEVRIRLTFPRGRPVTINARHDFAGSSMWNPGHGPMKAVQMGEWDDITIAGHMHISGYGLLRNPQDGRVCHALRVGSYKIMDRYQRDKGFRDQRISPAVLTVIDPECLDPEGVVTVFHHIDDGVRYLRFRRAEWKRQQAREQKRQAREQAKSEAA